MKDVITFIGVATVLVFALSGVKAAIAARQYRRRCNLIRRVVNRNRFAAQVAVQLGTYRDQ
jgi:hypothetical protein